MLNEKRRIFIMKITFDKVNMKDMPILCTRNKFLESERSEKCVCFTKNFFFNFFYVHIQKFS